ARGSRGGREGVPGAERGGGGAGWEGAAAARLAGRRLGDVLPRGDAGVGGGGGGAVPGAGPERGNCAGDDPCERREDAGVGLEPGVGGWEGGAAPDLHGVRGRGCVPDGD